MPLTYITGMSSPSSGRLNVKPQDQDPSKAYCLVFGNGNGYGVVGVLAGENSVFLTPSSISASATWSSSTSSWIVNLPAYGRYKFVSNMQMTVTNA